MCKAKHLFITASVCTFITILLIIACGGFDNSTGSGVEIVSMTGGLEFADNDDVDMSDITVSLGDQSGRPDDDGEFSIGGNKLVPGLASAIDQTDTTLMLMAIIPHPIAGAKIELTVHSTAIALVYMHPLVVVGSDYEEALEVLARIDSLPSLTTLENLLSTKLAADPKVLGTDDTQLADAIEDVVEDYFDAYPDYLKKKLGKAVAEAPKPTATAEDDGGIGIIPTTQVSGHMLQYMGKDKFQITNAYGRWAVMYIPRDNKKVFLSPNGSMMDFIRDGVPWAPSKYTFTMPVSHEEDTVLVNVYGYGISGDENNSFANLTAAEKTMTHQAGMITFILEFIGNVFSVVSNSINAVEGVDGYEDVVHDEAEFMMAEFIVSDGPFIAQMELLYSQEQYWDMAWAVFKKCFEKFMSSEFLKKIAIKVAGKALSDKQKTVIDALLVSPAFRASVAGVSIGNKVTSVMKTVYGFGDAQLKTTFKVYREVGEFGDISGYVMQKDHPYGPIEGAKVVLGGDESNPLPAHATQWSTDADGGFLFADCLIGTKTVTASMPGYKTETVEAVVLDDAETKIIIELEQEKGTVKGLIVNDIKSKWREHPYGDPTQDTLFTRDAMVRASGTVNGEPYVQSWSVTGGKFTLELPVATYWIVVMHDDYKDDSLQVTIVEDEEITPSRPFRMHAISYFKANNTYISDYAGSPFNINFDLVACSPMVNDSYYGGIMYLAGGLTGETSGGYTQEFDVILSTNKVKETGFFNIGKVYSDFPNKKGVTALYLTDLVECTGGGTMSYAAYGRPGYEECDCNIESNGNIIFSEFSTRIGDPIIGKVSAKLAGWKNCDCDSVDTNGDNVYDDIEVDCQIADLDITFKTVVGEGFWLMRRIFGENPFKPIDPVRQGKISPLLVKESK